MPSLDARGVASLLREYAQRTALRGGNPYRPKAYSRAADSLAALAVPLDVLIAKDRLTEIPGVGEAIADIITKLHKTGTHPSLEKLRKELPEGVLEMLAVPGLRPEKVLRLYRDLGISSLAELEAAAKDDRIKKAKGLGASLQAKILQNLAIAKSGDPATKSTSRRCFVRAPSTTSSSRSTPIHGGSTWICAGTGRRSNSAA